MRWTNKREKRTSQISTKRCTAIKEIYKIKRNKYTDIKKTSAISCKTTTETSNRHVWRHMLTYCTTFTQNSKENSNFTNKARLCNNRLLILCLCV